MPVNKRVTGRDVAERAGVSRATVSYVLNNTANQLISPETRARVLAAATELGYTPHAAARQLRTGVSDLILLAMPPFPLSHAFSITVASFTQRLGELGYTALVDPVTESQAHLEHTLSRLQPVAAVATGEHLSADFVTRLRAAGTRAVIGFGDRPLGFAPTVVFDQTGITRVAMNHLHSRGHHSVLAIMPGDPAFQWFREPRQTGAETAAKELGMDLMVVESELNHDRVAEVVTEALDGREHPDAVLAYNDDYALLALRALLDAGISVPDEVAVIGCDNLPASELINPQLTTVDIDTHALGLRIADTLHGILCTGTGPDVIPFPTPAIVQRDSA